MSEVNVLADRLFDAILDRYPVDAGLMGFDVDHESLVDHGEEADQRHRERLQELGEPAQALAYMVGRLKFQELREKDEAAGKDVRDYHEVVEEWIAGA